MSPHPRPLSQSALPHHRARGASQEAASSGSVRFSSPSPGGREGGWERGPGGEGLRAALGCLLVLLSLPALAQPAPRLDVTLNPRQVTVGDRIEAVLTLRVDPASLAGDPRFPVWEQRGRTWGEAEVLEKGQAQRTGEENGAAVWRQRVVLAAFRTGRVELPPVAVAVPLRDRTLQVQTPAGLAVQVRSVFPSNEKDPKPKPAAPPRQLPIGAAFWWTLAALSAVALLALWAVWRQGRRTVAATEAARPPLPPFDELLGELDRLGDEPSTVRLHTRLSRALRQYLGRSLDIPALESTTSEIQRRLALRLPGALVRPAAELLRACDLVKFARQEVGQERTRERVAAARQIARVMEQHLRPVEPVDLPERLEKAG